MAPDPGKLRTVGCNLERLIPDATLVSDIRTVVERVHVATVHASMLLNLHVRRCMDANIPLDRIFDGNWIVKAFYEVTRGDDSRAQRDAELTETARALALTPSTPRAGLKQLFQANANNMATVAHNNVWMHFRRRLFAHARRHFALSDEEYAHLSAAERRERRLNVFRVVDDLCSPPTATYKSPAAWHPWVTQERTRLGIDEAVGEWGTKSFGYHLKARAAHFLKAMRIMSAEREAAGGRAFSLFPLRRNMVPRHVRFDAISLNASLGAMRNEKMGRKRKLKEEDAFTFANVVDYRAAGITQRWRIKDGFTTDGVCARVQHSVEKKGSSTPSGAPRRGLFAIDELKRVSRLEEWKVVGVDPGKRELIVAVDAEAPRSPCVRYTQRQRSKDIRSMQYAAEARNSKPFEVTSAEEDLTTFNSRTADTQRFAAYCTEAMRTLDVRLAYYEDIAHRKRRWKTVIKTQQSEERVFERLGAMQTDSRPLVLAYGSWGAIAGRPGAACNKGNPPCVGVGLMRKLAKRFVVALTPEHYTSKTCCRCHHECGPHPTLRTPNGREIRGLRVCQNEDCKLHQNRDRTGAINIGVQFSRLFQGMGPIRQMTTEEIEFTEHRRCMECEDHGP